MFKRFEHVYGIDLGTSNTVIYQRGKGIVLDEPSVVAMNQNSGELLAVGKEAEAMIGRAPAHVELTYPLRHGVIANFDMTSRMLQQFIRRVQGRRSLLRGAQVYISVPCGITSVQKRAVEETVVHKGARKAVTVEEPLAAALGAGLPIEEPAGYLVLDIGGGTCQVAVLSLGGIVASHTVPRAGMSIDRDIMEYVKRQYNLEIGERTAEHIKKTIGTANRTAEPKKLDIRGRDVLQGLPRSITLTSTEIYPVVEEFLGMLVDAIRATLERCPPELAGDVVEHGIMLCGGGALLEGLDARIQAETGVPVHRADQPLACTALGTGMMLSSGESRRRKTWSANTEGGLQVAEAVRAEE
ncbi:MULTISPECIES: rod shape-determining protein [unclassified Paenibacillus]|uniref:rod shape-determining protein n=1 Tax=unclassified Paenibacillus TaxID=185978 RepID=UPI000931C351|nr:MULTISPECIES: rod shape-determining protein [unclassified Paenibacillus]